MREIKFRGWFPHPSDPTKSKWVYGFFYIDSVDRYWIKSGVNSWRICRGSEGQFTSLTDKNEKEVYEGDIDSKGRVVEYKTTMSGYYLMKNGEGCHLCHSQNVLCGRIRHLEIVGNIYENPKLT